MKIKNTYRINTYKEYGHVFVISTLKNIVVLITSTAVLVISILCPILITSVSVISSTYNETPVYF